MQKTSLKIKHFALGLAGAYLLFSCGDTAEKIPNLSAQQLKDKNHPAIVDLRTHYHNLADKKMGAVWLSLPQQWQADCEDLRLQLCRVDPKLYNELSATLKELALTMKEREVDFHAFYRKQISKPSYNASYKRQIQNIDNNIKLISEVLLELSTSKLASVDGIKTLNFEQFMDGTGSRLIQGLEALSGQKDQMQLADLKKTGFSITEDKGNSVKIRIDLPDGTVIHEARTKKGDHWVNAALAQGGWQEKLSVIRLFLTQARQMNPAQKEGFTGLLSDLRSQLQSMRFAKSSQEFQQQWMHLVSSLQRQSQRRP